ncbi:MAG: zinc-ribbon and DUF3426 domain-containing protein [Dyella sp.]
MYTQCPDCLSVFSLEAAELAQARGRVACGRCRASFDALARLTERLPATVGKWSGQAPSNELPILTRVVDGEATSVADLPAPTAVVDTSPDHPGVDQLSVDQPAVDHLALDQAAFDRTADHPAAVELPELASQAIEPPSAVADFSELTFTPRFAQPRRRRWRLVWVVLCVLLALLLLGQVGWAERDALIANPTTGDWLRRVCRSAGCQLPLVQNLHQLRLLARDVQSHPSVRGALMISATLRNEARFAQPYPTLSVTLSDVDGKKLAMRRLNPTEYLSDAAALQRGIAAGSNVSVVLEVQDPGNHAVAFELAFE